jgi:hypothetical protein
MSFLTSTTTSLDPVANDAFMSVLGTKRGGPKSDTKQKGNGLTLEDLFSPLDGKTFSNSKEFDQAVVDICNEHLGELPVGFKYRDAIDGSIEKKWLIARYNDPSITVEIA